LHFLPHFCAALLHKADSAFKFADAAQTQTWFPVPVSSALLYDTTGSNHRTNKFAGESVPIIRQNLFTP